MNNSVTLKNIGIFILLVFFDIAIIQIFRYLTPRIVFLRLGFIFIVLTISIYLFYVITKPANPVKTGIIFSIICFIIALTESYIVHIIIEKTPYKLLYLLPGSFALVLPILLGYIYKKMKRI